MSLTLHAAIEGCTDPTACNYNADATVDDGSCVPMGCMDPEGLNFNSDAGCQTTCIYPGDCDLSVTISTDIAYGFSGAFGLIQADVHMPLELLEFSESMMTIVGGDNNANGAEGPNSDHRILWVAQENISVQFAYAVASWDDGILYDRPYYAINADTITLNEDTGDDPFLGTWMVDNGNWNPNIDLMVPYPDAIPYPEFEANQVFSPMLLKTPLELMAGDTLTIGVHSLDNAYGEVVLALTGMLWTAHCTPEPEDILGCKELAACNFNPDATVDDGSCVFPGDPCNDGDVCTGPQVLKELLYILSAMWHGRQSEVLQSRQRIKAKITLALQVHIEYMPP